MNVGVDSKSEPKANGLLSMDSARDNCSLNLEHLNQHVKPLLDSKWYDLGVELLEDDDDIALLNELQCEHPSDNDTCCTKMFQMWLGKRQVASWSHLIKSLRQPTVNLNELASKIELMIPHPDKTCQCDTVITTTSVTEDFRNLMVTVSTILDGSTSKDSDLEKCKNYCSSLKISDNSDQPLFSSEYISMIHECTDFTKLFRILNWQLGWDEHSILTLTVAKCQSVKAQEEVENFDKKLAAICGGLDVTSSAPEYYLPAEFEKFCVVINKPYDNLTKSEYEEIKDFIFKQLDIRHYVATRYIKVIFHFLHLELEWHVAKQAAPFMIDMAYQNKDAFVKERFVYMQIGEQTIFDNQGTKVPSSLTNEDDGKQRKRSSLFQRGSTQGHLLLREVPQNAVNKQLQKILKYRAKSCLEFFNSISEQSDENSDHNSSRSSSRSSTLSHENTEPSSDTYGSVDDVNQDDIDSDTNEDHDDALERQNTESITHEASVFSALDYVARTQDEDPMSELLMRAFDNDDIEGIIPPRFLVAKPDAIMDNIRKVVSSASSSSAVSSRQSSLDGEASIPSYNVHFVRQLRTRLRVSTAAVSRASRRLYERKSFTMDDESLASPINRISTSESVNSRTSSLVGDTDELSVSSQPCRRHRKFGMMRSRDSVLQWIANRALSSTDSNRSSMCSWSEEKLSVSGSEASDVGT